MRVLDNVTKARSDKLAVNLLDRSANIDWVALHANEFV